MALVERFVFKQVQHHTGTIVVAEGERDVPFAIRRAYFLFNVPPHETRGAHAHRTLTQVAICAQGSCRLRLDNGRESADIVLNRPNEGVLLPPMVWHQMTEFSAHSLFLVLADDYYDESDYIRSYDDFQREVAR